VQEWDKVAWIGKWRGNEEKEASQSSAVVYVGITLFRKYHEYQAIIFWILLGIIIIVSIIYYWLLPEEPKEKKAVKKRR
jgi:hypothetical protein